MNITVHNIGGYIVKNYLLETPDGIVAIDTGYPGGFPKFKEGFEQLFCGDAAMNAIISVARHTIWIEDAAGFGESWDKMLSCEPKMIYPSHGNPFKPEDLVKYRHYLDGRKLIPPRG